MGCTSSVEPQNRPPLSKSPSSINKPPPLVIPPPMNEGAYSGSNENDREKESQIQSPSPLDASNKGAMSKRKSRVTQASQSAVLIPNDFRPDHFTPKNGPQTEIISDEDFTSGLIYTDVNYSVAHGSALLGAIKRGDRSEMESIITEHFHDKVHLVHDVRGLFNSSPLIVAAQYGRKEILLYLLSPPSPATPPTPAHLNHANDKGATVLHYACIEGLSECVELILKNGGSHSPAPSLEPLYLPPLDSSLVTCPLATTIIINKKAIFTQLINAGVDVNTMFTFPACRYRGGGVVGMTPLLLACAFAQETILREILYKGGMVDVKDADGAGPLHHLARCVVHRPPSTPSLPERILDCFTELRNSDKLAYNLLNDTDNSGDTPLLIACGGGKGGVFFVRLLLEEGANPSQVHPTTGLSPLHLAIKSRCT
eukprot:gene42562-52006_t